MYCRRFGQRMHDRKNMAAIAGEQTGALSCYAIRMRPGEELKQSLLKFVREQGLRGAFVLSCVGSVTQAKLRLADASAQDQSQVLELKGRYEIVSLTGTLSGGSGHLHTSLADGEGRVFGGHVLGDMVIYTTAEIVIGNCERLEFVREMDQDTGFPELVVKQNT